MSAKEDVTQDQHWRQEVISRVQQHRARRRRRLDPNATMELDFKEADSSSTQAFSEERQPLIAPAIAKSETPKIIEFRRPPSVQPVFVPQDVPQDTFDEFELAEPVLDSPRILEAPAAQMDLLPSFADLQLESVEAGRRDGVETPPQSAALQQRAFAGLVDLLIVLVASATFAVIYLVLVHDLPQPRSVLVATAVATALLWLVYQYLFLVHSSSTPGMRMAQLELCTFQGGTVSRSLRRWRALASLLSCCSLGLGFAWALIDEDMLGWHDRITQTHVRTIRG